MMKVTFLSLLVNLSVADISCPELSAMQLDQVQVSESHSWAALEEQLVQVKILEEEKDIKEELIKDEALIADLGKTLSEVRDEMKMLVDEVKHSQHSEVPKAATIHRALEKKETLKREAKGNLKKNRALTSAVTFGTCQKGQSCEANAGSTYAFSCFNGGGLEVSCTFVSTGCAQQKTKDGADKQIMFSSNDGVNTWTKLVGGTRMNAMTVGAKRSATTKPWTMSYTGSSMARGFKNMMGFAEMPQYDTGSTKVGAPDSGKAYRWATENHYYNMCCCKKYEKPTYVKDGECYKHSAADCVGKMDSRLRIESHKVTFDTDELKICVPVKSTASSTCESWATSAGDNPTEKGQDKCYASGRLCEPLGFLTMNVPRFEDDADLAAVGLTKSLSEYR